MFGSLRLRAVTSVYCSGLLPLYMAQDCYLCIWLRAVTSVYGSGHRDYKRIEAASGDEPRNKLNKSNGGQI